MVKQLYLTPKKEGNVNFNILNPIKMKSTLRKILRPYVPQTVKNILRDQQQEKLFKKWEIKGQPVPPPHLVKQMAISEYQEKYGYTILVETGTYMGHMVEAQKKRFKKVYSIELGVDLFHNATKRFKNDPNVTIIQGDSGKVLPDLLLKINEPAIFWLDGHYSGGVTAKGDTNCPIFDELSSIFSSKKLNHILLIDDARLFVGKEHYPTIDEVTEYVRSKNANYKVEVKHDIIRYFI